MRFLPLAILLASGCQVRDEEGDTEAEEVTSLYFERLGTGLAGSIVDTTEVVLRSAEEWDDLADMLRPMQPFGAVDFSQMVVLVAAVAVPSGGYSVEFESVVQIGDDIIATYRLVVPGPDCLAALGQTLPFQAISARRSVGTIRFVRILENLNCTA